MYCESAMIKFLRTYTYPVPGEAYPSIAKYWAQPLDFAGKVGFDYTDPSQSDITEKVMIACGGTHSTSWGVRSQHPVTVSPLSTAAASLPRAEAPRALIIDALSAVWPKEMLEASDIILSSQSPRFVGDVVDYVTLKGDKEMDLGTALAQVATAVWVEGVLLTRHTDYCVRKCVVLPRPKAVAIGSLPGRVNDTHSIKNPYSIFPRRLWDLVNNRVVDVDAFAGADGTPRVPAGGYWAISHSWTADMKRWMTPINNYRWPVPLPEGVTFEQIRWEALRAGAVYCWLDVLCLRQRTMEQDTSRGLYSSEWQLSAEIGIQQRLEEWSIDVPTIGNNYRQATYVLRYFNGLGRPLQLCGWGDPRHWLNRAWTLQETRPEHIMVNGAIPEDIPLPLQALVSMGVHEADGTQQQMWQVLAPLARLVTDAEPDNLGEQSILDVLWPTLRSQREERTKAQINIHRWFWWYSAGWVLIMRCIHWKIALLQPILDQADEVLKYLKTEYDLNLVVEVWAVLGAVCIAVLARDATVAQMQILQLQGTGLQHTIARRLRHWFTSFWALLGGSILVTVILYCWGRALLGGSQDDCALELAKFEAPKAAVLSVWLTTVLWFRQFVWLRVRGVFPEFLLVLIAVLIVPSPSMYLVFFTIRYGWMRRQWDTWKSGRSVMFNPKAEAFRYSSILDLACEMGRRHACNELDKIAGLAYLMKCRMLPLYSETEGIEGGWLQLVQHLNFAAQLELLFNFPTARYGDIGIAGDVVGEAEADGNVDIPVYSAYHTRSWIPTWKAVSSLQRGRGVELMRPTWPPSWLKGDMHASELGTLCDNYAAFDYDTGALVVPVCPRVIMTTSISWDDRSGSYSVYIAGGNRTADFVHRFYCPYGYSLPPFDEHIHYVLVSHARDNHGGLLSWVVGQLISPNLTKMAFRYQPGRVPFGTFCHEIMPSRPNELSEYLNKYVGSLGLPPNILFQVLLVRKVGVLVTDDMRPFTLPDIDTETWCAINMPVVFI